MALTSGAGRSGVVGDGCVLTVAADPVMDDLQAQTAAAVLDLGDRLTEAGATGNS